MSTCYSMSFKISSIGIRAHTWMTFKLAYLGYFGFPNFWFGSHFFFHLVLILGFQALLILETCRKYCLEQNIFFFMVFGAHLMRFRKLGLILVLTFMRFLCNFWVYIEGLMFEDGNLSAFVKKCTKVWPKKKISKRTRLCSA